MGPSTNTIQFEDWWAAHRERGAPRASLSDPRKRPAEKRRGRDTLRENSFHGKSRGQKNRGVCFRLKGPYT